MINCGVGKVSQLDVEPDYPSQFFPQYLIPIKALINIGYPKMIAFSQKTLFQLVFRSINTLALFIRLQVYKRVTDVVNLIF